MSGLAAVFVRDGAPVEAAEIGDILHYQAHRGPNGLRIWCDGPMGFGYAALEPSGAGVAGQPLVIDAGSLAIVGDLRIDNREQLIGCLEPLGDDDSDAELVLAAYRRWGVDSPQRLVGAFAFVIWDATRQRIVCARDHLGVKPLAYHLSRGVFVCASEAEAVPYAWNVPRRINEARIADFLVSELEGVDHTSTFFEGVDRLPPAHLLVVGRDGHQLRCFWRPEVEAELRLDSDEAYAEAFSETFQQAVGSCLTGVAAPGLLLSGGIDSSAIAGYAQSLTKMGRATPLTAYSAIDEENDPSPETGNILATIQRLGLRARTISPTTVSELASPVRRSLLDCGEPFDSYMVVPNLLFSMAARAGSRTVLDGVDGDVVASTVCPTAYLLKRGDLRRVWHEAAARRRLVPGLPHPLRVIAGGAFNAWSPGGLRRSLGMIRDLRGRAENSIRDSLVNEDFARRVGLADRLETLWGHVRDDPRGDPWNAHTRAVTHPYVAVALERYDRVAARAGIDIRHPFFDLRLVELCLSLPWDLKVRDGWSKFVLRMATNGRVSDGIRWRHDNGDVLWRPTSRVIAEERYHLQSILQDHEDKLRPYVDLCKFERIRGALEGNPADWEEVWIWEAAALVGWLVRNR